MRSLARATMPGPRGQCAVPHVWARRVAAAVLILTLASVALGQDRIGFREDFSSADGWRDGVWPGCTGMAAITTDGQQATFATLNGSFMVGASAAWAPDWPDWDKNVSPGLAMIVKKYPVKVDLDRYHYLVVRMPQAGTYMALGLNGWDTKVCYAPGTHAVDLRDIPQGSLRGVQPLEIRLTFLNTEGKVVLDEVRLVDELTPEERTGLIPGGLNLRLEKREAQPYHGLEALNARAGAPVRFDMPTERAIFRDTSTGAEVWRMTSSVRTEAANTFSPDGALLPILNRSFRNMVFYDLGRGEMQEFPDMRGASVFSRERPGVIYMLQSNSDPQPTYTIRAMDLRTRQAEVVADVPTGEGGFDLGISPWSDLLLVAGTGPRFLYLVDPRVADPARRVRRVDLPMRMKGAYLSHHDQRILWQRCYYFQRWQMDLATGQVQLGGYPTYGGHEISGRELVIGRYGSMMLAHSLGVLPLDEAHANEVRLWSNWTADVPSDYGQLAADDRWLVTNGTQGEVANKRLLIDGNETGTVLQIVHDFTSRNSWDSNTYTRISPDTTKLAYMCDMFGDTDVYIAVTRRPQAPRQLTAVRQGGQAMLKWEPPAAALEVRGYNIYRSATSGRDYRRLNTDLVPGTQFIDPAAPASACYAVAAEEHSGLEGLYSEEACVGALPAYRLSAEVEEGQLTPPLRQYFEGSCGNYRCARLWQETAAEKRGQAEIALRVPAAATYRAWLRVRGAGALSLTAGETTGTLTVAAPQWTWQQLPAPLPLKPGACHVVLTSESDGLCVDRLLLTSDARDIPTALDERDRTPGPVTDLQATEVTFSQVRLRWAPSPDPDLDHVSVYVGTDAGFTPGNATLLSSGKVVEALDWGFRPGSTLFYKVVATNKRGREAAPATLRVAAPPLDAATIELKIADAQLAGGLVLGESRGVVGAHLPAALAKDAPRPQATWQFAAPREGTYYAWAKYTTYDAKNVSVFWVDCDGRPMANGVNWRLRFPQTLTRHLAGTKPGEETWFTDKVMSAWWGGPVDHLDLAAGAHTLAVSFDPAHAPDGPRLAAVYLSNDPSYRPPGYDPRIDFIK